MLPVMILPRNALPAGSYVPLSPSAEFENSDAIFMATVASIRRVGEYHRVAKLTLLKLWKGEKALAGEIFSEASRFNSLLLRLLRTEF